MKAFVSDKDKRSNYPCLLFYSLPLRLTLKKHERKDSLVNLEDVSPYLTVRRSNDFQFSFYIFIPELDRKRTDRSSFSAAYSAKAPFRIPNS